jgi:chromosome condensin MukBEF complex kleisin-like MukF subunit
MKFSIECVHCSVPDDPPQLFAKIELPDLVNEKLMDELNEKLKKEIVDLLNKDYFRDCIFSIKEPKNHSKAMKAYWQRRKQSK